MLSIYLAFLSPNANWFYTSEGWEDQPPFSNTSAISLSSLVFGLPTSSLRVSRDSLGRVELLEILFLLRRQDFARRRDRLVQALEAAETNDGAGHALVDPSQGDV